MYYKGICVECGYNVESTFCEKTTEGYICKNCGTLHTTKHGKVYYVRMTHIDGKRKTSGRITLGTPISNFISICGVHGWLVSEYTPVIENRPVININVGRKKKEIKNVLL